MKINRQNNPAHKVVNIKYILVTTMNIWRHQLETFSALLAFCAGNSPVTGEFSAQRPVTRSFDVLFDLRLNKRLSKQSWGCWFETLSRPLWRHCNECHGQYCCPPQYSGSHVTVDRINYLHGRLASRQHRTVDIKLTLSILKRFEYIETSIYSVCHSLILKYHR